LPVHNNYNYEEEDLKLVSLKLSKVIMDQNYYRSEERTFLQHEGLAVGAPHINHPFRVLPSIPGKPNIYNLQINYNISGYFRYVDDTLITYRVNTTNIADLLNSFNKLTPNLKFTLEKKKRKENSTF
jgi:hypothetical protein